MANYRKNKKGDYVKEPEAKVVAVKIDEATDVAHRLDAAKTRFSEYVRQITQIQAESDINRRTSQGRDFLAGL